MVLEGRMGNVEHMQEQIRFPHLVQSALEGFDQLGGQLANETHRIGQQEGQVADHHLADRGVEGGEQLVLSENRCLAQDIHQGRFAHIGIPDQSHTNQCAPVSPLRGHLLVDLFQVGLQFADAPADDPAIGLDLPFSGSFHADPSFLFLQVGPHLGQSGQQVLILGQFHLGSGMAGPSTCSKNVEDQMGSVHDLHAEQAFDVLQLRGRQLVVEDDQIHSFCLAEITDLLHFPTAEIGFGMGYV